MIAALDIAPSSRARIAPPIVGTAWRGGAHRVALACDVCGREFVRYASNVKKRNFCSEPCRRVGMAGSGNPKWRGGRPVVSCKSCGKIFNVISVTVLARRRGQFCSIKCKADYDRVYPDRRTRSREGGRRREARVRAGADIATHTLAEWQALLAAAKGRCAICKKRRKLERDHIIPLSKGGSDAITNIQPVCHSCNCSKHNRRIYLL